MENVHKVTLPVEHVSAVLPRQLPNGNQDILIITERGIHTLLGLEANPPPAASAPTALPQNGSPTALRVGPSLQLTECTPDGRVLLPYTWSPATIGGDGPVRAPIYGVYEPRPANAVAGGGYCYLATKDSILRLDIGGRLELVAGCRGSPGRRDGHGGMALVHSAMVMAADGSGGLVFSDGPRDRLRCVVPLGYGLAMAAAVTTLPFQVPEWSLFHALSYDYSLGVLYVCTTRAVYTVTPAALAAARDSGLAGQTAPAAGTLLQLIAGSEEASGFIDGVGRGALFGSICDMTVDSAGRLYITDMEGPEGNTVVRLVDPAAGGVVQTLPARLGKLSFAARVTILPGGWLCVYEWNGNGMWLMQLGIGPSRPSPPQQLGFSAPVPAATLVPNVAVNAVPINAVNPANVNANATVNGNAANAVSPSAAANAVNATATASAVASNVAVNAAAVNAVANATNANAAAANANAANAAAATTANNAFNAASNTIASTNTATTTSNTTSNTAATTASTTAPTTTAPTTTAPTTTAAANAAANVAPAADLATLSSDLNVLLTDPWCTSDVVVVVGGNTFPAHSSILMARCEYFRRQLTSSSAAAATDGAGGFGASSDKPSGGDSWDERGRRVLHLAGSEASAFSALLRHLYTGTLEFPTAVLWQLWDLAERLLMPRLAANVRQQLQQAGQAQAPSSMPPQQPATAPPAASDVVADTTMTPAGMYDSAVQPAAATATSGGPATRVAPTASAASQQGPPLTSVPSQMSMTAPTTDLVPTTQTSTPAPQPVDAPAPAQQTSPPAAQESPEPSAPTQQSLPLPAPGTPTPQPAAQPTTYGTNVSSYPAYGYYPPAVYGNSTPAHMSYTSSSTPSMYGSYGPTAASYGSQQPPYFQNGSWPAAGYAYQQQAGYPLTQGTTQQGSNGSTATPAPSYPAVLPTGFPTTTPGYVPQPTSMPAGGPYYGQTY